jgi:hypothetical protein
MRLGYEAEIHQGVWKRPQMLGAPKLLSGVWLAACLYSGLLTFVLGGLALVIVPLLGWFLGQGILVSLTLWDQDWDLLLVDCLCRRSATYYDAG